MGTKTFGVVPTGHSPGSSEAPSSMAFIAVITPSKAGHCVCEAFPGTSAIIGDGFEGRSKS